MKVAIRVVGLGWAAFGLWIIYRVMQDASLSTGSIGFAVILVFLLFILPGLLLAK